MAQMSGRFSRRLTVSAISLLFGTAAHGSYYPGQMDPVGNGTVPGFTGPVVFSIPDSCIPDGGTGSEVTGSCGCGDASVYSGTVFLYSITPNNPPGVLDQFSFGTSVQEGNFDITDVHFTDYALDGVDTVLMGPEFGSSYYSDDEFWLQFSYDAENAYLYFNSDTSTPNQGGVTFGGSCGNNPVGCTVPEPGTLGLILGALGGGWLARRRKGNTAVKSSR